MPHKNQHKNNSKINAVLLKHSEIFAETLCSFAQLLKDYWHEILRERFPEKRQRHLVRTMHSCILVHGHFERIVFFGQKLHK